MIPSISIPHDRDHHRQEGDHDGCVNGRRNQQDCKASHFANPAATSLLRHDRSAAAPGCVLFESAAPLFPRRPGRPEARGTKLPAATLIDSGALSR